MFIAPINAQIISKPAGLSWISGWITQLTLSMVLIGGLTHMREIAILSIDGYRKGIAPALKIHCAYAHAFHAESCSAYARRVIGENGFYHGALMAIIRFRECGGLLKGNP